MKAALVAVSVAAVGCAAAAVHYHGKWSEELARVADLEARINDSPRIPRPVAAERPDEPAIDVPDEATPPPIVSSAMRGPGPETMTVGEPGARSEERERMMRNQRALRDDPEYREAMRLQRRLALGRSLPDLAQELNLTPEEASRFLDLLTEQQMRMTDRANQMDLDPSDPSQQQLLRERAEERMREQQAEIAAAIGADGLDRWQQYQASVGARMRARQIDADLSSAGMPLTDDQRRQVTDALIAHDAAPNRAPRPSNTVRGGEMLEWREQRLAEVEQSFARARTALAPVLSSEQMKHYELVHQSELTMQRMQIKAQRTNLEARQRNSGR